MFTAKQKTDENDIAITFYVNPNLFWFKYEGERTDIRKLETEIQRYVNKKQIFDYSPLIGELVIVRHCSGSVDKWLRARVDHVFNYQAGAEFILWALDYGFPLRSTIRWIRKLDCRDLQVVGNTKIFKGGLMSVPAALEFDFVAYKHKLVKKPMWSEKAIALVEELLFDAEALTFCCKTNIKGHGFGDVVVKLHSGKSTTLKEYLGKINESMGKSVINFEKEYQSLIHKPYWEYSQHNIFKIQENNFKVSCDDNIKILQYSTCTDAELSKKMSDWDRRNAYEINEKISDWDDRNSNTTTTHNVGRSTDRISPPSHVDDLNDKLKKIDMSEVPLSKRYDYIKEKKLIRGNEGQKRKSDDPSKDKLVRIDRKSVIYPAGYRL